MTCTASGPRCGEVGDRLAQTDRLVSGQPAGRAAAAVLATGWGPADPPGDLPLHGVFCQGARRPGSNFSGDGCKQEPARISLERTGGVTSHAGA